MNGPIGRYVLFGLNLQIVYTVKTTLTNINKSQGIAECKCKVPKPLGLGFHDAFEGMHKKERWWW